jgi:cysteine desulfurase
VSAYCDYNAGAPVRPEAAEAVTRALGLGGNASSVHRAGRRARAAIEDAREALGVAISARANDIVFTSGATEALHLAVEAARAADPDIAFVRSMIEHDALAELPCDATFSVGRDGVADLEHLDKVLAGVSGRPLVALMAANNETGVIQPVAEAGEIVRRHGGLLLCDAVQALGRIEVHAAAWGADYLVVSSHKIGGPPGAGALVLGCDAPFASPRRGGGQERGRRSGTENAPAIAGFGVAAEIAAKTWTSEATRLAALRDAFERAAKAAMRDIAFLAADAPRLCNTSLFALPGMAAETMVIALDLAGVCVSAGAACSSGKVKKSRVLEAMGAPRGLAAGAVRASFGWASTAADTEALVAGLARMAETASAFVKEADV